jgi:hypothetical protein
MMPGPGGGIRPNVAPAQAGAAGGLRRKLFVNLQFILPRFHRSAEPVEERPAAKRPSTGSGLR